MFLFGSPQFLVGTKKWRDVLQPEVYSTLFTRNAVYKVQTIEIINAYLEHFVLDELIYWEQTLQKILVALPRHPFST